jgi:voltage-gated potassium channel
MSEMSPLLPNSSHQSSTYYKFRAKAYQWVEGTIDSPLEYFILFLILLNVISFVVGTIIVQGEFIDGICVENCVALEDKFDFQFEAFELFSVVIFTVEYCLRIWAAMENPVYHSKGSFYGRLKYAFTFFCLVDLISILPYWLNIFGFVGEINFSTAVRMFRLFRLLKADKYVNAFSLLGQVMYENGPLLLATSYYAALMLVLSSTALYFTERNNPELGKYFQSIPHAMFPTLLMLTGEFPLVDFTPLGSVVAAFVAVVAVAIFAIPTAILGGGFVKAVERAQGRQFTVDVD